MAPTQWEALIEATLDGVHFWQASRELQIHLTCAWGDMLKMRIIASGVDDFLANEMRLLNIIDRVHFYGPTNFAENITAIKTKIFYCLQGTYPASNNFDCPGLEEKMDGLRNGNLKLLEIEPVYGTDMLILARDIYCEPIDPAG